MGDIFTLAIYFLQHRSTVLLYCYSNKSNHKLPLSVVPRNTRYSDWSRVGYMGGVVTHRDIVLFFYPCEVSALLYTRTTRRRLDM